MHPGLLTDACLNRIKIPEGVGVEATLGKVTILITNF